MSDVEAAEIIVEGLTRRKTVIAFPGSCITRCAFSLFLPPRWVYAVMLRFSADVPETN